MMKDRAEIRMKGSRIYIIIMILVFFGVGGYLTFGARSSYSERERRELAGFPAWSSGAWADGSFTEGIAAWYADTVPQRDAFTTAAMALTEVRGVRQTDDGEDISFHNVGVLAADDSGSGAGEAGTAPMPGDGMTGTGTPVGGPGNRPPAGMPTDVGAPSEEASEGEPASEGDDSVSQNAPPAHVNETIEDNYVPVTEDFSAASNGIIVTGSGENTRAIMLYGGSKATTTRYAECANHYKELMPELNVYVCVIPTAVSYYCPQQALSYTGSQLDQINNVMECLDEDVIGIDIYTILGQHRDEPIYLRTDHHWAPLGAYYAASKIAEAAGVPFLDLSEYDEFVVHGYVGSMYMYSEDIRVSSNPEDFVWYEPKDVEWKTTYINYALDASWRPVMETEPFEGQFFQHYPDGSGGAYCTFMGGDAKITRVETSTKNGRKLLILKDSFGNAIPGFLFGSFEEVHVIDSRYFTRNIVEYIEDYGITDLLFANNAFHASTPATINSYERYLTQNPTRTEEAEAPEAAEEAEAEE